MGQAGRVQLCLLARVECCCCCCCVCPAYEVLDGDWVWRSKKSDTERCRDGAPGETKLLTCDSNPVSCSARVCCSTSSTLHVASRGKVKGIFWQVAAPQQCWLFSIICRHFLESLSSRLVSAVTCTYTLLRPRWLVWKMYFLCPDVWMKTFGAGYATEWQRVH